MRMSKRVRDKSALRQVTHVGGREALKIHRSKQQQHMQEAKTPIRIFLAVLSFKGVVSGVEGSTVLIVREVSVLSEDASKNKTSSEVHGRAIAQTRWKNNKRRNIPPRVVT